jgi:hypothetical protein
MYTCRLNGHGNSKTRIRGLEIQDAEAHDDRAGNVRAKVRLNVIGRNFFASAKSLCLLSCQHQPAPS